MCLLGLILACPPPASAQCPLEWQNVGDPNAFPDWTYGVNSLTVYNVQLIAGGFFNSVHNSSGTVPAANVARWDGVHWNALDPCNPDTSGLNGCVYSLTEWDGKLIAGGLFSRTNTSYPDPNHWVPRVGRYDPNAPNGGTWEPLTVHDPNDPNHPLYTYWYGGGVVALAAYDGKLVVGGHLGLVDGVVVANVAEWNGSHWAPIEGGGQSGFGDPNWPPGDSVSALSLYGGDLIVGGAIGFQAAVKSWNGSAWADMSTGFPDALGGVSALAVFNGDLLAAGVFGTWQPGDLESGVARWTGSEWVPLASGRSSGLAGTINALAGYDGALYAGGWLHADPNDPNAVCFMAKWDGAAWTALTPDLDKEVYALTDFDCDLVVGGFFQHWGVNHLAQHVARLAHNCAMGDMNCDGLVDFEDIAAFVLALYSPSEYPNAYPCCDILNGDCGGAGGPDGSVTFADINCFIALLGG
jgi:hypothetical protein